MGSTETKALQRRTLRTLVVAQMLGGAGLAAGVTVGALLAEDMLGTTGLSGLPAALFTAGSAAAALLVGRLSQQAGRRVGLTVGYATGAVGGAGIVLAAIADSVPLFLPSLVVYGAGTATNLQARYAGADLADPTHRGRAVSTVLVATTVGAVAGPNLVDLTGRFAEHLAVPRLAGPFMLATVAYALAAVVLHLFLRPDPLLIARELADSELQPPQAATRLGDEPAPAVAPRAGTSSVRLGATAMVLTQAVMIAVMTMTPIHMRDQGAASRFG